MKPASSIIAFLLIAVFVAPFSFNISSVQGAGPTEVGGILWDNTTWTPTAPT